MTGTTGTEPALTDVSLLPCAEWCDLSGNYHRDVDEDGSFGPPREHVLEFDPVVAGTDQ